MLDPWFLLQSPPSDPAFNMAADQILLETVHRLGKPVLRLYSWTCPAATFGYFQRYLDIAPLTKLRPLIRRTTGGGLVPHDADWTYSVAFPSSHTWYGLDARESYAKMHRWLRDAFARLHYETVLAPCCDPSGPGQCFIGAEPSDLLFQSRKIAGAAQRRSRLGLLIQGSIQPPQGCSRVDWEQSLITLGSLEAGILWRPFPELDTFQRQAEELAKAVYGTIAHTERR